MITFNEGIKDYLSLIGTKLNGVIDDTNIGKGETAELTNSAKNNFKRYMGRNNLSWGNVTWGVLYKYLTLLDQLGLTGEEVLKILQDPTTKSGATKLLTSQSLLSPGYFTKYWIKTDQPISGASSTSSHANARAELICTYIIELAAMKHLDKKTGGEDMPSTPKKSRIAPGAAPTSSSATSTSTTPGASASGPLGKPTAPAPTGNPEKDKILTAIYKLQMASYILQGGTP